MQPHLEIEFGHLSYDGPAERAAREGMDLLQKICPTISSCHVTLAGPPDGHHLGQPLNVQIRISVSGTALQVEHIQQVPEAPKTTVRSAFRAAHELLLAWLGKQAAAQSPRAAQAAL